MSEIQAKPRGIEVRGEEEKKKEEKKRTRGRRQNWKLGESAGEHKKNVVKWRREGGKKKNMEKTKDWTGRIRRDRRSQWIGDWKQKKKIGAKRSREIILKWGERMRRIQRKNMTQRKTICVKPDKNWIGKKKRENKTWRENWGEREGRRRDGARGKEEEEEDPC